MEELIPYGRTFLHYTADSCRVLKSRIDQLKSTSNGEDIVRQAMQKPIKSPRLSELSKGKRTATIIISDHTRPVPSKDILPPMLEELRKGNPAIEITLLVATGFHRGSTKTELINKLGTDIMEKEHIIIHDAQDMATNCRIGILPSGAPLMIDRVAAETELLVAEGFIEPHFFAGFSGGRKSVLPGICSKETVLGNHCGAFIDSPYARTGILDHNPLHMDMLSAAVQAKLAYIVNVIIDENKRTVAAFAGNPEEAHRQGCEYLRGYCGVEAIPGDIVITSNGGAPLDQNVYQCVKGLTAAEASAKKAAVLIMCAECADGSGGDGFYRALKECTSPKELYDICRNTPQSRTAADQWEAQILARILCSHTVIFVTEPDKKQMIEDMKMRYAKTLEEAMQTAVSIKGKTAQVTVIPNGISVIVNAHSSRI